MQHQASPAVARPSCQTLGVIMSLAPPIIFLIALVAAIVCGLKALWHAFGMARGVRASSEWWVNLVPFVAFAFSGALDSHGQVHRTKFALWLCGVLVFASIAAVVQFMFHS